MPKKDSDTKTKSNKGKKSDKGCVGYFYGGVLKTGQAYVFSCESNNPQEVYDEQREHYGRHVTCKYVVCEDADKILEKLKKELNNEHEFGSIYSCHSSTLLESLKKVSGIDRSKTIKEKPEKDGDSKKKSKKSKNDDGSGSEDEDEDASGEDGSGSDDEKPTKKGKGKEKESKSSKGKKSSKDDDEDASDTDGSGEDGSGSDDEKPTKVKTSKKGGKDEKKAKGKGK